MRNFYLNSLLRERKLFTPLTSIGDISYSREEDFVSHFVTQTLPEKKRNLIATRRRNKAFHSLNNSSTDSKARENIYFLLAQTVWTEEKKEKKKEAKAKPSPR